MGLLKKEGRSKCHQKKRSSRLGWISECLILMQEEVGLVGSFSGFLNFMEMEMEMVEVKIEVDKGRGN